MIDNLDIFKILEIPANTKRSVIQTLEGAVTYSRVSTNRQAINNHSLDTQEDACKKYCLQNDLKILESFGYTHESAKTEDRKEFQRMLSFIRKTNLNKKAEYKVRFLVVYSIDRFSRGGNETFPLMAELKKLGVKIISVTAPVDTDTSYGELVQDIGIIFGKFDNNIRKEKIIAGTKTMLLKGGWPTKATLGYDKVIDPSYPYKKSIINAKGKLIKKAFRLKLDGYSNTYIRDWLKLHGLVLTRGKLSVIFKNSFYCGINRHSLLDYEPVRGNQEKIVSEEDFIKINDLSAKFLKTNKTETDTFPLKYFLKCHKCGGNLTAYSLPKKKAKYYKCNNDCKVNYNSDKMHILFKQYLDTLNIDNLHIEPLKQQLAYTFAHQNEANRIEAQEIFKSITKLKDEIEVIAERHALGEIDRMIYQKFTDKRLVDLAKLDAEYQRLKVKLSNLEKFVDVSLKMCSNLSLLWEKGTLSIKQRLQNVLFPQGLSFDKEIEWYRTSKINKFIDLTISLSNILEQKITEQKGLKANLSGSVVPTRITLYS